MSVFRLGRSRERRTGSTAVEVEPAPRPGGKGRPTPRRSQAQARNQRPLVPTDRKAAVRADRAKARDQRLKTRRALLTGEEAHLPPRDKGPMRRFVRDFVDARWNVGEVFILVALAVVLVSLYPDVRVQLVMTAVLWAMVLVSIVDGFVLARKLRRALERKFGAEAVVKGTVSYGVMRAYQLRRTRLPRPRVKHGEYPS